LEEKGLILHAFVDVGHDHHTGPAGTQRAFFRHVTLALEDAAAHARVWSLVGLIVLLLAFTVAK
jgi:hypothetical protein